MDPICLTGTHPVLSPHKLVYKTNPCYMQFALDEKLATGGVCTHYLDSFIRAGAPSLVYLMPCILQFNFAEDL